MQKNYTNIKIPPKNVIKIYGYLHCYIIYLEVIYYTHYTYLYIHVHTYQSRSWYLFICDILNFICDTI